MSNTLDKDTLLTATLINMQTKISQCLKDVEESNDLREVAEVYGTMSDIVYATADELDEIEKKYE